MALKFSTSLRNARANQIEAHVGASPSLKIFSGDIPASPEDVPTGDCLVTVPLPIDWLTDPLDGVVNLVGTWEDTAAEMQGIASFFRIYDSGDNGKIQGTVSEADALPLGDMILDNTDIAVGQVIEVIQCRLAEGNR